VASGDVVLNSTTTVKAPTPKNCPTLPLTDKEISAALEKAEDPGGTRSSKSFCWSGLRIGDVNEAHARVNGAHPHRFRDSFAVALLESGASLETVSTLLEHSSIRITDRHYSPWGEIASGQPRKGRCENVAVTAPVVSAMVPAIVTQSLCANTADESSSKHNDV